MYADFPRCTEERLRAFEAKAGGDGEGRPAAGARQALSTVDNDSTCAQPTQSTTSDAEGGVAFSADRRERFLLLIPDQFVCYNLRRYGLGLQPWLPRPAVTGERDARLQQTVMAPQRIAPLECVDRSGKAHP